MKLPSFVSGVSGWLKEVAAHVAAYRISHLVEALSLTDVAAIGKEASMAAIGVFVVGGLAVVFFWAWRLHIKVNKLTNALKRQQAAQRAIERRLTDI